tara:strand:+ start:16495 stop:17271 length:777 start_codon:yes stop_codon:yes gene_type:complete
MSETLTMDNSPESEVLTPEEQDSLKVGEEMQEAEDNLLAGKYKDAKDLESAYLELQKKLGTQEDGVQEDQETTEEVKEESNPHMDLISTASEEFYASEDQSLSEETIEKFSSMSSKELVSAYLQSLKNAPAPEAAEVDMSDADINDVQNSLGGEKGYNDVVSWAGENLPKEQTDAFDQLISTGNKEAIKLAAAGLKAQFDNANGYEGRTLTGKPAKTSTDTFRSQAELVAAMADPRYDNDPAYREDIIRKLDRSNVNF